MKRSLPYALLIVALLGEGARAHRHVPSELPDAVALLWGNSQALSALWTQDGDLVFLQVAGSAPPRYVEGQKAIGDFLGSQFAAIMRESTYTVKQGTTKVRQLGDAAAVVDFEATIQQTQPKGAPLDHRVTMVVVRAPATGEEPKGEPHTYHWSIAAMRMIMLRQNPQ